MAKEKKHSHIDFKDSYISDSGKNIKNRLLRSLVRTALHRRVSHKRISYPEFSLSFSGTKLFWYSNFLNDWYAEGGGKIACFFTEEGAEVLVIFVKGDVSDDAIELPNALDEYLEDRQAERKDLQIDLNSVVDENRGDEYRFQYKGTLKDDTDEEFFEYTLCEGIDKVVLRAIIPKTADTKTLSDVKILASSLKMIP